MEKYEFIFDNRKYELNEDNFDCLVNDEENPIEGVDESKVLELLGECGEANFDIEYYGEPCANCFAGKEEKAKAFKFLEYHFYVFSKQGKYVISSISKEYKNTSYNKLLKYGKVDNSYIVSIIVCVNCGRYLIEIEQCEV